MHLRNHAWHATSTPQPALGIVTATLAVLFLATSDMTVVSTLLPMISASVGGNAYFPWLMSIFMAMMAFSGLSAGALADRHGMRVTLTSAVALFLAASMLAALSSGIAALLLARALQGVGAGVIIVLSYASLAAQFGLARHARVQMLISITWGVAAFAGPVLGLLIANRFGWRWVFALNLPIGIACLGVLLRNLAGLEPRRQTPLDGIAQVSFALLILALMLATSFRQLPIGPRWLAADAGVAAVALATLAWRVLRAPSASPLPLAFFTDRGLRIFTIVVPCASMGLYASITFVPMALMNVPSRGGWLPLPVMAAAAGFVSASALAGALIERFGFRTVAESGALCLAAGALILSRGVAALPLSAIAIAQLLIGMAMGAIAVVAVVYAQCVAPAGYLSTYTSTIQVLRNGGAALGINLFSVLQQSDGSTPDTASNVLAFGTLCTLSLVCIGLTCGLPKVDASRSHDGPTTPVR